MCMFALIIPKESGCYRSHSSTERYFRYFTKNVTARRLIVDYIVVAIMGNTSPERVGKARVLYHRLSELCNRLSYKRRHGER